MYVKPAPGVKVRDPITRHHLPEAGATVPVTAYWLRRLRAGDVVVAQPAPKITPPQAPRHVPAETPSPSPVKAKGKE